MSQFATIRGVFCGLVLFLTIVSAQRRSFEDADHQLPGEEAVGVADNRRAGLERNAQRAPAKSSRGMQGKFKRKLVLKNKEEQNEFAIEDGYTYSFGFGSKDRHAPVSARRRTRRVNADYDYHTSDGENIMASSGASSGSSRGAGKVAGDRAGRIGAAGKALPRPRNSFGSSANLKRQSAASGVRGAAPAVGSFQARRSAEEAPFSQAAADFPDYSDGSSFDQLSEEPGRRRSAELCARRGIGCQREGRVTGIARPRPSEGFLNQRQSFEKRRPEARTGFGDIENRDGHDAPAAHRSRTDPRQFQATGEEERLEHFGRTLKNSQDPRMGHGLSPRIIPDNSRAKNFLKVQPTSHQEEAKFDTKHDVPASAEPQPRAAEQMKIEEVATRNEPARLSLEDPLPSKIEEPPVQRATLKPEPVQPAEKVEQISKEPITTPDEAQQVVPEPEKTPLKKKKSQKSRKNKNRAEPESGTIMKMTEATEISPEAAEIKTAEIVEVAEKTQVHNTEPAVAAEQPGEDPKAPVEEPLQTKKKSGKKSKGKKISKVLDPPVTEALADGEGVGPAGVSSPPEINPPSATPVEGKTEDIVPIV